MKPFIIGFILEVFKDLYTKTAVMIISKEEEFSSSLKVSILSGLKSNIDDL